MDLGLHGKVAIVAGASRGMGRGIARELAQEGVHVAMVGRKAHRLDPQGAAVNAAGGGIGITADMSERDEVARALEITRAEFGDPDIAVTMSYYVGTDGNTIPG